MSILIKGMDMPEDCLACRFRDGAWCIALGTDNWRAAYNSAPKGERLSDCPLVEIPPHGDLIDKDVLFRSIEAYYDDITQGAHPAGETSPERAMRLAYGNCLNDIEASPTIIESEGE